MTDITWKEKDLGPVDAYALAVAGGYTGTKEQWIEEIANASTNASNTEAYAKGTRGGQAVTSDDPAYHNNAEYFKDLAQAAKTEAQTAAASASAAYGTALLAPNYSTESTYKVGDHVIYNGNYYVCNTAISTAESWTAAHWSQITVGGENSELKSALGFERYTLSASSNKELCKLYPVSGHIYSIYGKINSYVTKVDFYEFYTDGTNSRINRITGGTEFDYLYTPTSANVSYLRIYIQISGGTGTVECIVCDFNSESADLSEMLNKMYVSSYGTDALLTSDNNCLGFTDVRTLPCNKIWSISDNVTSALLANLPEYGVASTVAVFASRPKYADNRFSICLYDNNNGVSYVGFITTSSINWSKITNEETEKAIESIKEALGYERFTFSGTSNGELGIVYPLLNHMYHFTGKSNSNVTYVDIYEFYSDSTNSRIMRLAGDGYFEYIYTPTANNVSYVRIYITVSTGTGTAECMVYDVDSGKIDISQMLNKMYVGAYGMDIYLNASNNCYGYTDAGLLPQNKVWAISADVTEQMLAHLPEYGETATMITFSPRPKYADNRFGMSLYINNNQKVYVGFKTISTLYWNEITNNYRQVFGDPVYYEQTGMTGHKELAKLYPASGKEYDIICFDVVNCNVYFYEFDTNGNYITYGYITGHKNGKIHYKPSANASYLRIYCRYTGSNGETATAKAVVLESENVLSCFSNRETSDATDFMLSKEFAAVRKFTVIGDSMASGYYKESSSGAQHGRNIDYSWPQIMARMYGQTAVNATQSGATTESWWEDASGYCKAMVTSNTRSQVYIMALGTNDYKDVSDADITQEQIATFISNYCRILDYVHQVASDAKIICCTIPKPRPNTTWKQEAIRGICADSTYTDFVCLCDLEKYYSDLSNSDAMTSEMWQGHFTPVGYANSAAFLMYTFSKTIQRNLEMFINLPQIPFDPVS